MAEERHWKGPKRAKSPGKAGQTIFGEAKNDEKTGTAENHG
jgi:hypothetical protein